MFGHQDSNKDESSKAARTVAPTAGSGSGSGNAPTGLASSLANSIAPKPKPSSSPPPVHSGSNASSTPLAPIDLKDLEKDLASFESSNTPPPAPKAPSSANAAPVIPAPSRGAPTASTPPSPSSPAPAAPTTFNSAPSGDLQDLKLTVLHELTPLVDQLEQTAEEHFRTLMMMIQSAEDRSLLPKAYEAAHKIKSEKVRAQALLDVVNEINYFTQPQATEEE